jgi:hypothetical protein
MLPARSGAAAIDHLILSTVSIASDQMAASAFDRNVLIGQEY